MYPLIKVNTVTIVGLLSVATGIFIIIGWILQFPLLQTIIQNSVLMVFGSALGCIILGGVLLVAQFQLGKHNTTLKTLNKQLEDKSEESLSTSRALSEKLKNCKGDYQSVIELSFDAIYLVDFDGNFIDVNPSMCKMTGYTRAELLKLNIIDLIDPEQLKTDPVVPFRDNYDKAVIKERRLINKNGGIFDVEINIKKFADNKVMVVANDITRRKQLEIELHEAELKFHTLAEKSTIGIYVLQKEKIIYLNHRFAEIFGYEPYELVNNPTSFVDILINEDHKAIVRKNLFARYSGEIDYVNYEVTGKKKDGSLNHVEFSGSRTVVDGEPTIIGTMMDITDRWKTEDVLKRYEANLQTILDTTDVAYALFDKNLKVTSFNEIAEKFASDQYNHKLETGDSLEDYFPGHMRSQFTNAVHKVLEGDSINYEINYPQPGGAVTWYYARLLPITNKEKEIFGLMLALSNITERKIAEDCLHAAYERIQGHINSIKEMAWKQSHLIRSPLANLKGLVALLKDDPSDKEIHKNILVELDRLDAVIIEMAKDASDHDP